ncbi:AAA family ATPase [Streptomyces sp. LaPpAH-108]|uniref:AAA family ATPase n=1 Tax=Streptomyces sp. LaPpAH-108 TaxID=1155714 RepID=UPI00039D4664|nr:AAA family ATPase [Streptomyces sp. LaPpAH-108]
MGVHRETLYRRLRALRVKAEAAYSLRHEGRGLQLPLERQVRRTGLPGTSAWEGKVASRWAPRTLAGFGVPQPRSADQVLAMVAVWESWTGARTLEDDGRVRSAWLASDAGGRDWQRLLEAAHRENAGAIRRKASEASASASGEEAEADAAVERYFARLVQTCGRLNLDVLGGSERAGEQPAIRLPQVFEAPPASWDPPKPDLPARLWQELMERGEIPAEELPPGLRAEQVQAWRGSRVERPPVPVLEAVASPKGRRLVLLGDPGAGKSTLSRYLALALAGGLPEVPSALRELVTSGTVPVVVELRRLADGKQWQGRTVEDFWEEFNATERMRLPRHVLEYLLERTHRPVLVVFDGLDEIFDPCRRAEVARQVAAFAEVHAHVRVVVTSRVIGFGPEVFADAGFSRAKIDDLPRRQIESFIRRWYAAAHPAEPGEASRLSERLISAVRGFASVAELAGNPLLLTILASIGLGATIPRDRRQVYRHAVEVLTGRWDRDAKHLALPRQHHPEVAAALDELDMGLLQELLERLARRLQESASTPDGSPLISRDDLTAMIADYVTTDMNYEPNVGRIVAHAMVERLQDRAFLLHPYGAGMYGFVHRTFLEYLAARELGQRYAGREWPPEQLIDMLAERAGNPVWHEVILLFIGQISRQAEAEHAGFIARLLRLHRISGAGQGPDQPPTFLELAVRALAEAHRIPRAPSQNEDHPELSLAIQSNAVIDALIAHLGKKPASSLDGAIPALMSFPWSWTGRERFLRWHRAEVDNGPSDTPHALAAALCRTPQEIIHLARLPWPNQGASTALRTLGERWPELEEVHAAVLDAARDTGTEARDTALEMLAQHWPDREETYAIVLGAARDTSAFTRHNALEALAHHWPDREEAYATVLDATRDTSAFTADIALEVLADHWPDREETYTTVLDAARSTDSLISNTTLRVLAQYWPDREETYAAVLGIARGPHTRIDIRGTTLYVLAQHWPDREDAYTTVLDIARDTTTSIRGAALSVLGEYWPDQKDSYTAVLDAARDTTAPNRGTALHLLTRHWPDREDTYTTVLGAARDTTAPDRGTALSMLGEYWPDQEDAYTTVLDAASDPTTDAHHIALGVLVKQWPDREGTHRTILGAARDTRTDTSTRDTVLRGLARHWPDREDTYTAVLGAAHDTTAHTRNTALRLLAHHWPDREDTHTTVLKATHDTTAHTRVTALNVLTRHWPDREDTYTAVLGAAHDTTAHTRDTALHLLTRHWPDREDTYTTVLDATDTYTRATALRALAQRWPDREGALTRVAHAAATLSETNNLPLKLLTLAWPDHPETRRILLELAEKGVAETDVRIALRYTENFTRNPSPTPTQEGGRPQPR